MKTKKLSNVEILLTGFGYLFGLLIAVCIGVSAVVLVASALTGNL